METSLQPLSARDGYHHMSSSAGIMTFPMYGFVKKKMFQTTNQIRWLYHVEHIGLYHNIHNMIEIDIEVNIFRYTHSILVISLLKIWLIHGYIKIYH